MGELERDGLAVPGRVVLAHEDAFRLGRVQIHPATRQVEADGRTSRPSQVSTAIRTAARIFTRADDAQRPEESRSSGVFAKLLTRGDA